MPKSILRDNAYGEILAGILDGRIAPGESLREEKLAAELNVSRTPIREALHKLAEEGFVAYLPHRGARLLEPTPALAREVFEIREGLEGVAARDAAVHMEEPALRNLRKRFDLLRPRVRAGDVSDVGDIIHEAMLNACGNPRLVQTIGILRGQIAWFQSVATSIPARPARAFREHLRILAALEARDPRAAEEATRAHIQSTLADLLQAFQRQRGGTP